MSKSIIHCPCGAKVAVASSPAGQRYRCPQCKKPIDAGNNALASHPVAGQPGTGYQGHQAPGYAQAPTATGYPHAEPTNGFGLTGFILSLVSFAFILLAPVAFIISLMGLRKPNSGFAIAGAIISALQSVMLVIGIILMVSLGWFGWMVAKEGSQIISEGIDQIETYGRTETSKTVLASAADDIDRHTIATHKLPTVEEADEILKHRRDGWNQPLRFEIDEGQMASYSLICPGEDGEFDTNDDIAISRPSCAPTTVAETIMLLNGETDLQRQSGIEWALEHAPEDIETQPLDRKTMIEQLLPLLADPNHSNSVDEALVNWIDDESLTFVVEQVGNDPNLGSDDTIDLLISLKATDALLGMLNDRDIQVRGKIRRYVEDHEVDEEVVVDQCIDDLSDHACAEFALINLRNNNFQSIDQDDLANRLLSAVRDGQVSTRHENDAVQLASDLSQDADLVPILIAVVEETYNARALELLGGSNDARVAEHFAGLLGTSGRIHGEAVKLLTIMGPIAEDPVLKRLESAPPTGSLRGFLIDILRHIGTEKSLPALAELTESPGHAQAATQAIAEIESRSN